MHLGVTVILIPQHPNLFTASACFDVAHAAFDDVAFFLCMKAV